MSLGTKSFRIKVFYEVAGLFLCLIAIERELRPLSLSPSYALGSLFTSGPLAHKTLLVVFWGRRGAAAPYLLRTGLPRSDQEAGDCSHRQTTKAGRPLCIDSIIPPQSPGPARLMVADGRPVASVQWPSPPLKIKRDIRSTGCKKHSALPYMAHPNNQ